jgi:hypothetical protein
MFKIALKSALYVYPEANVKVVNGGIMIKPSKPPIPFHKNRGLLQ